jgi:hypothetical protein
MVGVLVYNKEESAMVEVTTSARISRWLEEAGTSTDNSTIASEVLLVRRSLVWITGIILLISTLIGVSRGHSCPFCFSFFHFFLLAAVIKLLNISVPCICTLHALHLLFSFMCARTIPILPGIVIHCSKLARVDFVLV